MDISRPIAEMISVLSDQNSNNSKGSRDSSPTHENQAPVVYSLDDEVGADNGHKIIQWSVRKHLRPINIKTSIYWHEGIYPLQIRPNLGSSTYYMVCQINLI